MQYETIQLCGNQLLVKERNGFFLFHTVQIPKQLGGDKYHNHMELNARKDKEITKLYWVVYFGNGSGVPTGQTPSPPAQS